ncbi:MAG: HigA family addiction module antitoxin [Planctomycetes bacterium]|nr:HigA family addiction module antitoxin [Planctomycetota bacterium]
MMRIRTHPGEVLADEFMRPLGLTSRALAEALDVPPNRISDLLRARRSISADTAIRVGRYFGNHPRFWMNLQAAYGLSVADSQTDYLGVPRHAA